jgi:hypothetical protein
VISHNGMLFCGAERTGGWYSPTTLNFGPGDVAVNPTQPTEAPYPEAASAAEAMLTRFVDSWNAAAGFAYC